MFRKRLQELYKEKYKTIVDFADDLGMTRQALSFYLNGDRRPDLQTFKKICETLNVSSDWMLGLSEIRSPDKNLETACNTLGLSEKAANTILRESGEPLMYLLERPEEEWDLIRLQLENYWLCRKHMLQDEDVSKSYALPGVSGDSVILTAAQGTDYFARVVGDCVYEALTGNLMESAKKD